jgi:5-methylcytosine-specific restriction endonuclease McrA
VYCGRRFAVEELSIDHVEPRMRGGDQSTGNLVTACKGCNTLKANQRVSHFLAANADARANFLRYATHLWPRLERALLEELEGLGVKAAAERPNPDEGAARGGG